ncbi:hypothetical protein Fmac_005374 [Flemingia macrophylla]|uniref:SHSP domain-containing protein n=1 Tax=Flemingia macrophylla TaxID=520843 RepID=A0ABD1N7N0_9FABA
MSMIPLEGGGEAGQLEVKETAEAVVVKAEVPALRKEEVKVEVEDGSRVLHVSGQRSVEIQDDTSSSCHRVQRSSCKFKRCFTLPPNANCDQVHACIHNGVLTVTVPKTSDTLTEGGKIKEIVSRIFENIQGYPFSSFKYHICPPCTSSKRSYLSRVS